MLELIQSPTHASNLHGVMKSVEYIIIHDSGRSPYATDEGELSYLTRAHENQYCYHDYVFQNGAYHQLAPLDALLWHVNGSLVGGKKVDLNPISWGIALGNTNLPSSIYPKAQYAALVAGTKLRMGMFGLGIERVLGHKEVSAYRGKSDPHAFDMDKFRGDVLQFEFEPSKPDISIAPPEGFDLGNGWRVKLEAGEGPRIVQSIDSGNKVLFVRTGK